MTQKKTAAQDEPIDFGRSYAELEEIIKWFDSGEIDLDEGLKRFERGLDLAQRCRQRLTEVETRVNELKVKFGESV
ncbi:MAG: exodeoxyribonuclease VII small subunit [bacterium]